jgi:hypothetical protein
MAYFFAPLAIKAKGLVFGAPDEPWAGILKIACQIPDSLTGPGFPSNHSIMIESNSAFSSIKYSFLSWLAGFDQL